jgi:hypothetical protein
VSLLFFAAIALPAAASGLTPHRAQYKVKISVVAGELDTELRRTEAGFVAHHVIKPTGVSRMLTRGTMDVSSTFTSVTTGVQPVSYHAIDTIRNDPEAHILFDWDTNQASGTVGDEKVVMQLEGISHDAVSIQYELMHDLVNGGPDAAYVIFDVEKMRVVNVRHSGRKTIDTPAGRFDVVGIEHQKEGSSRITTLWCAAELGYLPVVIERHRKGKLLFRAMLTEYVPIEDG